MAETLQNKIPAPGASGYFDSNLDISATPEATTFAAKVKSLLEFIRDFEFGDSAFRDVWDSSDPDDSDKLITRQALGELAYLNTGELPSEEGFTNQVLFSSDGGTTIRSNTTEASPVDINLSRPLSTVSSDGYRYFTLFFTEGEDMFDVKVWRTKLDPANSKVIIHVGDDYELGVKKKNLNQFSIWQVAGSFTNLRIIAIVGHRS